MLAFVFAIVPFAVASPTIRGPTSQRIIVKDDASLCLTARGLNPQAGDTITIETCQAANDQYWLHQYWVTGGVDSTGPIKTGNLCISAGTATPSNQTELLLAECDGSASQSWYWFGGYGLEINNQCITRVNETVKQGVCAGKTIETIQTLECQPFDTLQTFDTSASSY